MCNWDLWCCGAPNLYLLEADHLGGSGPPGGGPPDGTGCGKWLPSGVGLLHYLGVRTVLVPIKLIYLHIAPGVWTL